MGAKGSSSSSEKEYSLLLDNYEIVQESPEEGLKYLESKSTQDQYLLREINCHDEDTYQKTEELMNRRQKQLQDNRHLAGLIKIIGSKTDQYCMTYYKIYALWQFPQRTLEDQINQRVLQKRRFQEKELWSILASCILALSHLQKEDIRHNALKSGAILINPEGIIRLYDPLATGTAANYQKVLANRNLPHLYLSPEQIESLREERSHADCDPYKTDIWTLGMILLQAGLLSYQDECYRQQCSRIHWDTLTYNMNRFQQHYSSELSNLLQFMLARDERARPDWAQLEEHVIRAEEEANGGGQGKQSETFIDKIFATIKETAKLNPFASENKGNTILDKKPLSTSKVGTPCSSHHFLQFSPEKQTIVLHPSDITETRPLRNVFPPCRYSTLTKIDENIVKNDPNASSQEDPTPQLADLSKNIAEFTLQGQSSSEQGIYVREKYPQGSRYEGYKWHGVKHGFGKFYYQDGGMYEGQWVWGHMQGTGKLYYQSDKLAYEGQWKNDQFNGSGTLYNEEPEILRSSFDFKNFNQIQEYWTKYDGFFKDDMKHGRGILYLSNGQFYEGNFQNDFVSGEGMFKNVNGERIRGRWANNLLELIEEVSK